MTHNQIDYWKMRNELLNNEQRNAETKRSNLAHEAETKRYNLIQEELKRIDQSLQSDLMAINARYKQKELDLAAEELEWKKRYQATQLGLEQSRVDIARQQNAINSMAVAETKRSNLVNETVARDKLSMEQALLPYNKSKVWSEVEVNSERKDLIKAQTATESTRPYTNMTQSFNNIISPFINLAGGILRAVR